MKTEEATKTVWVIVTVIVVLVIVGCWFDTDVNATILGKYSPLTLIKLGIISVAGYLGILYLRFLLFPQWLVLHGERRLISWRVKLLITLGLLLVGFISIEGVLQWRFHRYREEATARRQKVAKFDPFLQVVPVPGNEELHINRWGFRGEDIERTKPEGTYRIFVIGGSTVYCSRVDFEDTHARILEKHLRQYYSEVKIEVQNAGMHWHTSQHSLIKLLFNIQDFNPDMIIVYHAINDLYRSFSPEGFAPEPYRSDYSHYNGPVANMVRDYFQEQSWLRIRTLERTITFFQNHWFADLRDGSETNADRPTVSVNHWPSLNAFERNMTNLVTLARSQDIDVVMASQPYLYRHDLTKEERAEIWFPQEFCRIGSSQADIPSMINGMDAFNRVSRSIADAHDVLFVDLEQLVPKSLDYFHDDVHYTAKGNQLIGESFAEQIIAAGYIDNAVSKTSLHSIQNSPPGE